MYIRSEISPFRTRPNLIGRQDEVEGYQYH